MSANYPNANQQWSASGAKTIPIFEADRPSNVPVASSTTVSSTSTALPATSVYTYPSGTPALVATTTTASTMPPSESWTAPSSVSSSSSTSTWSESSAGYTPLPTEAPSSSGSSMNASAPEWFPSSTLSSWTPESSSSSTSLDTETQPLLKKEEASFIELEESPSLSSTTEDLNNLTIEKTSWESDWSSSTSSSFESIPSAPPAPPVYHYPKSRLHPYVKYGSEFSQPMAFTLLLQQEIPLWEESLSAEVVGWAGEKVEGARQSARSAVAATGEFLSELPHQAKETAVQTGHYLGEKAAQAKETAIQTGEYLGEKAVQAKETAVHTGEYLGEKAVQAKETIVPAAQATGEYLGEKAVQAKETIVPAAQATGEYVAEKAVQAKETLVPAMQTTGEYVAEKAHELRENLPYAVETAKETVRHTGEVLGEMAHSVLNWTEWTRLKAVALEQAAVETGKNILGKASETIASTFHMLHPEGWVEGQIPVAPPAPEVYHYPLWSRRRVYVKWGKGSESWAFTEIIKAFVPREEMGTGWAWGKRQEEFYDVPSGYWTWESEGLTDTTSATTTTETTTTTTTTMKEKERLPSFLGASNSPLTVRGK